VIFPSWNNQGYHYWRQRCWQVSAAASLRRRWISIKLCGHYRRWLCDVISLSSSDSLILSAKSNSHSWWQNRQNSNLGIFFYVYTYCCFAHYIAFFNKINKLLFLFICLFIYYFLKPCISLIFILSVWLLFIYFFFHAIMIFIIVILLLIIHIFSFVLFIWLFLWLSFIRFVLDLGHRWVVLCLFLSTFDNFFFFF
jgi:hypothetical protein